MIELIKRYRFFILVLFVNFMIILFKQDIGIKSLHISFDNFLEMLSVIPPVFILLGLLDVWVQRETMMRFMGEKSGLLGILLAFILGSAAAGPLYAAFPIAGVLLKKGCKFSNILIFIGAWSTTKIPMLLFETSSMGWKFMLTRFIIDIPGIVIIAYITEKVLTKNDIEHIYSISLDN